MGVDVTYFCEDLIVNQRYRDLWMIGCVLALGCELGSLSVSAQVHPLESLPYEPDEAVGLLHVREGYQAELVAAEPLVMDPVAIAWGADARLWVAEMADYPLGIDGQGQVGGRIRWLRDNDGDGKYDESVVFAEGLAFPSGVMPWRDGVFVTAAPQVLFLRDTTGDGVADQRHVMLEGFVEDNQQLRVNGLRWGLDNMVYCASGANTALRVKDLRVTETKSGKQIELGSRDFCFDPDTGALQPQSGPTQFGRHRDDWGNWFGTMNSFPLWHFVLEDSYLQRNPHFAPPDARRQLFLERNPRVYPAKIPEKRFRSAQHSGRFTSACSGMIYRDDLLFPRADQQHSFSCEPFHNLVQHNVLSDDGVSFVSSRDPADIVVDFFASKDRWCRPVMAQTGPDGALWVVDFYRYIIEHPQFLSEEGKAELEPHYRAGHDRGRIYRVFPKDNAPRTFTPLDRQSTVELLTTLQSSNGTLRDLAHQELVIRGDVDAIAPLQKLATDAATPQSRLQTLGTLDGLGAITPAILLSALNDAHPGVRRWALRLAEPFGDVDDALRAAALRLEADPDPKVRLQLACSLGQWSGDDVATVLGRLAVRDAADEFFAAAILSSIQEANLETVMNVVLAHRSDAAVGLLAGKLLAFSAAMRKQQVIVDALAQLVNAQDHENLTWQCGTVAGLLDALDRQSTSLVEITSAFGPRGEEVRQRVSALMQQARQVTLDDRAEERDRVAAIALMGREEELRSKDIRGLGDLLDLQTPVAIQLAAISQLGMLDDPLVADVLLERWSSHSPRIRAAILSVLPTKPRWLNTLLDAIAAHSVVAADIDSASRQTLLVTGNREQRDRIEALLASTLGTDRRQVVKEHQAVLQLEGDAQRGRMAFAKHCAACHQMEGVGNDLGPNLLSLSDKRPESLLESILDPSVAVDAKFVMYVALTQDGRALSGILARESASSITLLNQENKPITILRSELEEMRSTGKSLMPEGLEKQLTPQELADVIRYLTVAGSSEVP